MLGHLQPLAPSPPPKPDLGAILAPLGGRSGGETGLGRPSPQSRPPSRRIFGPGAQVSALFWRENDTCQHMIGYNFIWRPQEAPRNLGVSWDHRRYFGAGGLLGA